MSNPAPGWYPAPHANGEQRYWDGSQWRETESSTPPAPGAFQYEVGALVKRPAGLAITALIIGIVAFLIGWVPVFGAIVGAAAVIVGIIALARKQRKGMAITGLALGAVALLVSVAVTAGVANFAASKPRPPAAQPSAASEPEETTDEPVESEEPAQPTTPDLSTFVEVDDRTFALIAKDPDAHTGENIILYGNITQFDSATGRCAMLISTAGTQKEYSYEYDQNTMARSGDGMSTCPVFDPLVEDDTIKIWATVDSSFSYDTQIGGNTTVPMIEVWQVELLPATEY